MSSCPARWVALMPATMRWAQDCVGVGVVAALVAGVVGVVTGDVGVAGTVDVPGELVPAGEEPAGEDDAVGPGVDEQAARSATALIATTPARRTRPPPATRRRRWRRGRRGSRSFTTRP